MKTAAAATAMRLGAPGAILLALGFASGAHGGGPALAIHTGDGSIHIKSI